MKKLLACLVIISAFAVYGNAQSAVYYNYEASLKTEIFKGYSDAAPVASAVIYVSDELPAIPCDHGENCSKRKCKKKHKGDSAKACCAKKGSADKAGCSHGHDSTQKAGCSHGQAAAADKAEEGTKKHNCTGACCAGKKTK